MGISFDEIFTHNLEQLGILARLGTISSDSQSAYVIGQTQNRGHVKHE